MLDEIPVQAELRMPYNHTASIIALSTNELLVAWGAGAREAADDTAIHMARRAPDGTWSDASVVADTPGRPDANCVLYLDSAGVIHLYWAAVFGTALCQNVLMERRSQDGGWTWSDATAPIPAVCTLLKNKPIALPCGRWVLPAYVQAFYASQFWMSDDAGQTWRPGDAVYTYPSNLQPALALRSDGSLLALMRRSGPESFTWQGHSSDGGVSWTMQPRADLLNSDSGLDLLRLSNGMFVVAYDDSATSRSPLVARASLDEGRTWLSPRVISAGEGQRSYPSLAESPDGRIHCVFSDRLQAIGHAEFNLAWILHGTSG